MTKKEAKPLNEAQEQYVKLCPESMKGTLTKAFSGSCSPRAAIRAKCYSCANFQRQEATNCTITLCPLHLFRPGQSARKARKA